MVSSQWSVGGVRGTRYTVRGGKGNLCFCVPRTSLLTTDYRLRLTTTFPKQNKLPHRSQSPIGHRQRPGGQQRPPASNANAAPWPGRCARRLSDEPTRRNRRSPENCRPARAVAKDQRAWPVFVSGRTVVAGTEDGPALRRPKNGSGLRAGFKTPQDLGRVQSIAKKSRPSVPT